MKIAHIIWSLRPGGAECLTIDLANAHCATHEVSLIVINDIADEYAVQSISSHVALTSVRRQPGSRSLWPLLSLNVTLLRLRPDVIHFHNAELGRLVKTPAARRILTLHHTYRGDSTKHFDAVVAISRAVQHSIPALQRGPVQVIPNGVAFSRIRVRATAPRSIRRIVQVGHLAHNIKGQDILLRAIANCGDLLPAAVDYIGAGESLAHLQELAIRLGLAHRVRFLGAKSREYIYQNLCTYDLLVHPSRSEGFGLVVAEAMGARIPVLISNLPGPMEVLGSGAYGWYFDANIPDDCSVKLLEIEKQVAAVSPTAVLDDARRYAIAHYSLEHMAAEYDRVYRGLLNTTADLGS